MMSNQEWLEAEWKKNPAKAINIISGIGDAVCLYCECEDCTTDGDCEKALQKWLEAEHVENEDL